MNTNQQSSKKRKQKKQSEVAAIAAKTDQSTTLKIASTGESEKESPKIRIDVGGVASAFVTIDNEETELRTSDSFREFGRNLVEEYCELPRDEHPILHVEIDNSLGWNNQVITDVASLAKSRSDHTKYTLSGEMLDVDDLFYALLRLDVKSENTDDGLKYKNLLLREIAGYYRQAMPSLVHKVKWRLDELGFKGEDIRDLKKQLNENVRETIQSVEDDELRTPLIEMMSGMPLPKSSYEVVAPTGYTVNQEGVSFAWDERNKILPTPLVISQIRQSIDGEDVLVDLTWRGTHKWEQITVPRDVICDPRKIMELTRRDFPMTTDNALEVVRYLHAFEQTNKQRLGRTLSTDRLGIHFVDVKVPVVDDDSAKPTQKELDRIKTKVDSKFSAPEGETKPQRQKRQEQRQEAVKLEVAKLTATKKRKKAARRLAELETAFKEHDYTLRDEEPIEWETIRTTVFVLPDQSFSSHYLEPKLLFHSDDSGTKELVGGFRSKGQLKEWKDAVDATASYHQVRLAVVAALTPVLRIFLEFNNLILDYCGKTTSGKTTTLRLATAALGSPNPTDNEGSVFQTFSGTSTYFERLTGIRQNLACVLDESKLANESELPELIYRIFSGMGKGRGTPRGVQENTRTETIAITSGEQPITFASKDGGTRLRAIPFFGGPFGGNDPHTGNLVDRINDVVTDNYGHALPMFLEFIFRNQHRWASWRENSKAYRKKYKAQADAAGNKFSPRLASTLAAIDLCERMIEKCFQIERIDVIGKNWNSFLVDTAEADQSLAAIKHCYEFANSNPGKFFNTYEGSKEQIAPPGGWMGRWDRPLTLDHKNNGDWTYIGFFRNQLEDMLRDGGFVPDAVIRQWFEDNKLKCNTNRKDYQVTLENRHERSRLIAITRQAIDECLEFSVDDEVHLGRRPPTIPRDDSPPPGRDDKQGAVSVSINAECEETDEPKKDVHIEVTE